MVDRDSVFFDPWIHREDDIPVHGTRYYPVFEFAFAVEVMVRCAYFGNYYTRIMASDLELFVGNVCLIHCVEELLPAMVRGYDGILWEISMNGYR